MKYGNKIAVFSFLFALIFWSNNNLFGQTYNRTIDKSFEVRSKVEFNQNRGPLLVKKSEDGKVRFISELRVEADSKADAELFFDKLEADITDFADRLAINLGFDDIRMWRQNGSVFQVKFQDGTKIKGLKDFKIQTTLYLPLTQELKLSSKFDDIIIEKEVAINNLDLALHSASLEAEAINAEGNFTVDANFSKVYLANIKNDVQLKLHDSKVKIGNAQAVNYNARFSKVELGNISSLKGSSHEGEFTVKKVTGKVDIDGRFTDYVFESAGAVTIVAHEGRYEFGDATEVNVNSRFSDFKMGIVNSLTIVSHEGKFVVEGVQNNLDLNSAFSDYTFGKVGDVTFKTHEGTFEFGDGKNFKGESRFTDFKMGQIEQLNLSSAHEGQFNIAALQHLDAKTAYTDFTIDQLENTFALDAHEGDIEIKKITNSFQNMSVTGRFYEIEMEQPATAYQVKANFEFGNLNVPSDLTIVKQIEKGSQKTYEYKSQNANDNSPLITVEGHSGKVRIN